MLRTHTCGQLIKKEVNKTVELAGWVHRRRDHGGLIFIDLRDRYGLTQVKFDPDINKKAHKEAEKLRSEWVMRVKGKVALRPKDMVNKKLKTGEVEVEAGELEILSQSKTPPFELDEEKNIEVKEELRMKYRYIDLRRSEIFDIMVKRHELIKFIRDYLAKLDFIEVETPMLSKSTPEGARDFLVPSRLQKGEFYALPQSPQQYKQLLMLGGMDKYFQIAKCFRDEDTRGDRQAEFTQLDLEMSFVEQKDILDLTEDLFTKAIEKIFPDKKIMKKPWPRLEYSDVMEKYGSDKPDLRFGLEIIDLTNLVKGCGFKVFADAAEKQGVVRAICAKGAAKFTRKEIDNLTELAQSHGAKGLAYIVIKEKGELQSPIVKFLGEKLSKEIIKTMEAGPGDIIFFGADEKAVVCEALAHVRLELGKMLKLIDDKIIALAFILNFPLFEEEAEGGHFAPSHHMFTAPRKEDLKLLDKDPGKARSYQHDMVANGYELGGGSVRIHDGQLQEKIFDLIGFDEKKKKEFAHFLRAFEYGVPPHGGIAPGLDRILMVLMNKASIREVMAFPKTGDGRDLMMEAPSEVDEKQLKELGLVVKKD
ncbi:aspartate--tRNA ligase [Candidatus Falkowbacteria bacterium CG11_big_fil_rev_8_21_14_0_20_39_10]|uniref:Aspartate--tRNA(Asp/Asn) ligase n=1 Tax=Candidatus Falkowbacteria bacterium CG11_big_fil_rev_8_21_14_0_20_39_10 TaxID=1974570 RepID=A0A2M6K9Z3_9BACT|nr:MAG: aspartate--tRNA ligase [Candidatus Falkowbacteria bacterium CG11_big_fil_rev_8_21_14_0_20_39_10]